MAKQAQKTKKAGNGLDINVADLLIGAATATGPAKGKSSVPEMTGHGALADKAAKAYKAMKDAEAEFRLVEGEVLEVTDAEYAKRSQAGDHTKSLNLKGETTSGVQLTYQDKFSALGIEQKPALMEQLGDNYGVYFEDSRKLTLKEECTDDATIKLLIEKLGVEEFKRIFDIKLAVVCKADMDRKQFDLPEGLATLCGLKQAKASLKIVK